MKLKHFIFALVAMMSLTFSAFAQTTVSSEAELRAALESTTSANVVLGNDIGFITQITVPKKTVHTLDLNGHKVTGTNGIYVYGTLTIKDKVGTGKITANTYVLNGAGGSKIILEGGTIYRSSSWSVYTTGIFVVKGGEVKNTIRVAGSGTIELNGGTVTSIQVTSGNLNISGPTTVAGNLNIEKGAKGVNIAGGTINGDITIDGAANDKVTVSGGSFKDPDAIKNFIKDGSAFLDKGDGTFEVVAGMLRIKETGVYYPTLDAALTDAENNQTIELLYQDGAAPIAMNGAVFGKNVTITGTAKVDWNKGFLFVARGGAGNATLTFDGANLTSMSNSASYGIHVSGREKGTTDKYDGTVVIKNSIIELDYLINKGAMTLDNATLTVKNGFDLNGRPASETENGEDANATMALTNNSKLVVNNHNGMGIGREGKGELTVDATSTFEHTQDFLVCANGTMDVKGTLVSNGKKLTNNGEVKFTATKLTDATIEGTGTTRFYNDVNFYGANSITTTGINGTPFHLVVNEGANLFITRFVLGYDRNITVNGTIADASVFDPTGQTPSLKFNSASGVSVGGTGTGNLTVKNAYIELGSSSWKNAQGTYDWDFTNCYVSATSFTNATGADVATWDVTFDKSILAAKNYIKNGKNVTYNFTNNSRGTTGSLRIDGVLNIDATSSVTTTSQQNNKVGAVDEHGGINGTVNVAGNLTIGSNANTQLEVLGGKVNVEAGATLALGVHTMTLDAASALNSAGNISGAITAANGANVAISGGTYTQDVTEWCAEGFMTQQNADGTFGIAKAAAKVGDKKYASLEEAFKAATEGQTITLLNDATPTLTSQRAITKAAVIDLGDKTLTLTEDDLYFGTTTFKNGTIIVDSSVKPSTAVFWMFANQTLTFDKVKIVATGVTGTYLIGLDGNNSDLNLLNGSEILVQNTTALDLDIICVNASTGNDIKVENSKVNVTNLDGRVFFRGNYTVKDSEVNLDGITKAGFRIEAGQTLSIEGSSKVTIKGEPRDGGINLVGATASYTKEESATVNATVTETGFEAKIGDVKYATFNEAIAAAQDGAEVTIHKAGTYNVPSGKNITITGAVEGVKFANIGAHNMGGASMTFNNVTFEYGNENYKGLQHSGNLVYNNCTFNGQVFLYGQSETFNKCTFNQTSADAYNVWTYGAKEVTFDECTFNSAGKSVLIYHESAEIFNTVNVTKSTFNASQAVEGKAAIEMDASLTAGINLTIDETTATGFATGNISGNSLWNNKKGNADEANNDITVIVNNETVLAPIYEAKIGDKSYRNFQKAIDAVKDGETITLVADINSNVTLTEKVGLHYTINGADKTMNGKIVITPLSDENDNRRITIKGINFVNTADAAVDFISCAVTNHYPRLTVEGCNFTGNGKNTDVAVRLKTAYGAVIKGCTGTGLHSFLQNTAGKDLNIEGVTVTDSKGAFALGTVQGVTVKGSTINVATYGIRMDANTYNNNAVIEGNNVTAFIPVVVRKVNTQSNVTFTGENTFTAENEYGKWMVIGTTEYEENGKLPAEVAEGNVVVALNDAKLSYEGVHGAGLAGKGTEAEPYLINNVAELTILRNSVNAGSAKYSAPGICIALNADIDMAGVNWVGIGTATADHGFMGNFDGKTYKIKNLTIENPALDSDGYAYAGLFGVTEGTDKDNQNVIKNLTIENVTINTTGDIVSAAIAYPYYTNVDNVKVCGNIAINGGNYTAGVLAYTRRCVDASNLSIVGNEGSFVTGNQTVGGVISDIQMNGGLVANYSNFSAEGITVTGEKSVGGIAGIIATQTLNGATVKNVTLNSTSTDEFAGVVAGRLGGTSTISNVVSENVTGATAVVGATYNGAKAVEARIGDTYYSAFADAYTAAKANETVTLIADLNMSEILVLDKAITLDGNGKKLTSTAGRAINVDCEGNVGIKNLTINASGERAINVIQKPANVTIDNVTATAANYTVNVATSAGAAKVAITNSNLTGLNVVNVTAPKANVTINGGTITCNDQTDVENYAALNLTKEAENGTITATGVTFDIKGDSKMASNGAVGGVITIDGNTDGVSVDVAYIQYGNYYNGYTSIEAAIEAAKDGETIGLIRDITASEIITINKAITLDGNGKSLTSTAGRAINVDCEGNVGIKNLTINASGERAINVIQKPANVTIESVTATAANYTVNVAASAPNAVVAIKNSTLDGLCTVNVSAEGANVTVDNSTVNCNDNNTTAGEAYAALSLNKEAVGGSIVATNSTINVTDGSDSMKGRNGAENGTVTINGSTDGVAVMVAIIEYPGSTNYHAFASIDAAIAYAKAGETIGLIRNVTVANKIVINKSITIDGNNKTLTYTGTDRAIDVPNDANANIDVTIKNLNVVATTANRGLNYNENGKFNVEGVTVTIGDNVDGYAINFPGMADSAQVTIKDSKLTSRNPLNIWSENMTINVHNSEIISVDNSTTYDYAAIQLNNEIPTAGPNGAIANGTVVNVYGGKLTALNEKGEPSNVVANATETGVVNISNATVITGKVLNYVANIGGAYFGSLQAAVNAIEKHGYNSPIVIMKDFATSEATTIKSGLQVTINLNGKTITGTDNATGSFGLITNKGNLTINGEGAITLVATNDRDWNAYSSVISNTVGGMLTVNGGTIQHLGGTDMAYAIDNLTNGKGTYAETIINGGAVKSTYRAIRQFLNGTEAQNILTVNGGTIEGTNKSIWMQDASKNANTGELTVANAAKLNGDVYLSVTAGSTVWPVEISIAAAALQGESKVMTNNVPAGYDVAEVNGVYGVYTGVAKIGTQYYETLKAAVADAQAGETITLLADLNATEVILLGKSLTINGNGHKVTSNATRVFRVTTANTEVTLNDVNMVNTAVRVGTNDIRGISIDNVNEVKLTLNNCSVDFTDASANDWTYAVNVTGGDKHTITVDGGTYEGANVINVRSTNSSVVVKNATLNCLYPNNDAYMGACIYVIQNNNTSVEATGNTFNGDNAYAFNLGNGNPLTESDNIDNTKYVVAKIGDAYYTSIQAAVEAAQTDDIIKLIQNVKMNTKALTTQNDGYAVLVNVAGKAITLDLNGKKITVNAAASEVAGAKDGMLLGVFSADLGGHLTLTDNSDAKNGTVTLNVNDAKVYSMFASESGQSDKSNSGKITVNGGKYTTNNGKLANAMFFADADRVITINGGEFICDGASTTAAYPWMINTYENNINKVVVTGGTFNVDINHQYRPFEVKVPETKAVKDNGNGTWTIVEAEAYVTEMLGDIVGEAGEWGHEVGYETLEEAIAAVNELGNKVSIAKNLELTETVVIPADKTMVLDLNGKTVSQEKACTASYEMIKNLGNLTITDDTEAKAGKLSFKDTSVGDPNFGWGSYTVRNEGTLVVENGTIEHLGTQSFGTHCIMAIYQYSGSTTINGGTISTPNYRSARLWKGDMTINGGTFDGQVWVQAVDNTAKLTINGGTFGPNGNDASSVFVTNNQYDVQFAVTNGTFNGKVGCSDATKLTEAISGGTFSETAKNGTNADLLKTGFIWSNVNADGTYNVVADPAFGKVAKIGNGSVFENQYFSTINDAAQAAQNGETVTLIADVAMSAEGYTTITDDYAVMVAVKEKDITIDLNGKTVTVTPTAEELENAEGKMLMSVFGLDTDGKLTLKGEGTVNVIANGANVYSLAAAYGEGALLTIESGNYEADAVNASGSLIYSQQTEEGEGVIVNGGNFKLGNEGTGANDSPWIFNTKGQNATGVTVNGGTFNADINHQFWANEVFVPETKAVKANGDDTWTIVPAVAYTNEKATSRYSDWRHVGYATIEDAIAAATGGEYNCKDNKVTMLKDVEITKTITVANGETIVLDLNGQTIAATDNTTKNYSAIDNRGELTITDGSEEGTGKMTVVATVNSGWNRYSAVIANNPGGFLTIENGTIQHLGGTDMAYGIDNLTNGKGTYAETVINGGLVKSTYFAVRQFLNGVEAQNILTVNGGTLEGADQTKSIFFQDPSAQANSGTLYVGKEARLNGDVYIWGVEGSTEWPVEIYVAKAALEEGKSKVIAENLPKDYEVVDEETYWTIEVSIDEMTIVDDEYTEFVNLTIKEVDELTYQRNFVDTMWQTLYLPFDVPYAKLSAEFGVAYIYNASAKAGNINVDVIELDPTIDSEFVLKANYPYLIKANEAGVKSIVVENAVVMPTPNATTIDCSSVFETFSFIGSYTTIDAENLDPDKGYFELTTGGWTVMETIYPFRVYMQIENRDGSKFDPTAVPQVSMRRVDEEGNVQEIISISGGVVEGELEDGVEEESQKEDMIFDLNGRRITEPVKGLIYIINGQKVLY